MTNQKPFIPSCANVAPKFFPLAALAGALILLHSCTNPSRNNMAVSGKEDFADSSVSSVHLYKDAQGRKVLKKNNTDYDIVDFTDRDDMKRILLKITLSETALIDSGTAEDHFTVSAANVNGGKVAWNKDIEGADIDYSNKVLVAHTEAKNNKQEDTYTQYSLLTGEKLMAYTYAQLMVLIPGTSHKRFFGYLSGQSATTDKPDGLALVSYVGSDHVIDRVKISLKGHDSIPGYTPELRMLVAQDSGNTVTNEGKNVILGNAGRAFAPADISNFAMKISYYLPNVQDPIVVLLPVRGDRIDLPNAAYDKKIFELSRVD